MVGSGAGEREEEEGRGGGEVVEGGLDELAAEEVVGDST